MLEVHAILQRQRCNENITKKTGTLSDAYVSTRKSATGRPMAISTFMLFNAQGISLVRSVQVAKLQWP